MSYTGKKVEIRQMRPDDIEKISVIESQSFSSPWTAGMFSEELDNPLATYLVAVCSGQIAAYAGFWTIFDEIHITNIAVAPCFRRQHIGTGLIERILSIAAEKNIRGITLEVRAGNAAAIALYQRFGFKTEGRRKEYYSDNREDALIMWLYPDNAQYL